jgi:NADP-dependent 3-hydroxy acid dehydrogenase YdfG
MHTPKQDEKMPGVKKLDTDYVAGMIKWLLEQPQDVNISEICLDRIQK